MYIIIEIISLHVHMQAFTKWSGVRISPPRKRKKENDGYFLLTHFQPKLHYFSLA